VVQDYCIDIIPKTHLGKYAGVRFFAITPHISQDLYSQKFLGVPFNISSYALLTQLVAYVTGLEVGDFVYTLGDYHIYKNHLEQVETLLSREPLPLPELQINDPENSLRGLEGLLTMKYENLNLIGYKSHGKIAAPVAV
jgi:thymidylate synthase